MVTFIPELVRSS